MTALRVFLGWLLRIGLIAILVAVIIWVVSVILVLIGEGGHP